MSGQLGVIKRGGGGGEEFSVVPHKGRIGRKLKEKGRFSMTPALTLVSIKWIYQAFEEGGWGRGKCWWTCAAATRGFVATLKLCAPKKPASPKG